MDRVDVGAVAAELVADVSRVVKLLSPERVILIFLEYL
jgi:hypothetical protein